MAKTRTPIKNIKVNESTKNDKIKCAVPGCKYKSHSLVVHLYDEHGLDVENYSKMYPGMLIFNSKGEAEHKRVINSRAKNGHKEKVVDSNYDDDQLEVREKRLFSVRDIFSLDMGPELDDQGNTTKDSNGKVKLKDRQVQGFVRKTRFTPNIDPGYVFPMEETLVLLMGFASKDRMLLVGDTGTGKTSLVEQVCARLNYSVVKISFDGCITRNDLVGEWIVKGKEMVFQLGVLPLAFRLPGCVIILDEWDTIGEETSFVIQRPLQKEDGKLLIMETGGTLVDLHEDNLIIATANTAGQGDDTGLYSQGTRIQNYSQINRFGLTIRMKYLDAEKEKEMLKKKYPDLEAAETEAFVLAINKVRDGFSNGQISVPLSPRDLLNWADKYLKMGDPMRAARYCFLNRMSTEDSQVTEGIIQRAFEDA